MSRSNENMMHGWCNTIPIEIVNCPSDKKSTLECGSQVGPPAGSYSELPGSEPPPSHPHPPTSSLTPTPLSLCTINLPPQMLCNIPSAVFSPFISFFADQQCSKLPLIIAEQVFIILSVLCALWLLLDCSNTHSHRGWHISGNTTLHTCLTQKCPTSFKSF